MDSPPEESFDALARVASRAVDAPIALVSFVDDRRHFLKSAVGLPEGWAPDREMPWSHSYCRIVVASGEALVVSDARTDPALATNPAITDLDAVAYCGMPVADSDGRVLGAVSVMDTRVREWSKADVAALHDIATIVTSQVRARAMEFDLARSNEGLLGFVGLVSHDIRSPLGLIQMYAHVLAGDSGDVSEDDRREFTASIVAEVNRADRLVGDIVEITRLDANGLEVRPGKVDLSEVLEEALRSTPRSDAVTVTCPPDLVVMADRTHVRRMVSRLLDNALTHGTPPVSVSAGREGEAVAVAVTDEGAGIPPEFVPRLFTRFARADEVRKAGVVGSGLGLAIVAGLAALNGGSVRFERNEPSGARFVLRLPHSGD